MAQYFQSHKCGDPCLLTRGFAADFSSNQQISYPANIISRSGMPQFNDMITMAKCLNKRTTDEYNLGIENPLALHCIPHISGGEHPPNSALLEGLCAEHARASLGGTRKGRSICEQRDKGPTLIKKNQFFPQLSGVDEETAHFSPLQS